MPRMRKNGPTIGDVAALAEVSRATVSRVMNGSTTVDPGIAERVRSAAASLNYRPSNLARSLSLGRTGTVAVSVPDLRNPMLHAVLQGVTEAAERDGYHLLVSIAGEDIAAEEAHFLDARQRCDGLILINPRGPQEQLRAVLQQAAPAVVVNRETSTLPAPCLSIDHQYGLTLLIEHLVSLGHRHLAYVAGPQGAVSDPPRRRAVSAALDTHPQLRIDIVDGGRDVFDGRRAAESAVSTGATGVLVFNDLVAVGLLARLHELGVDVPGEVSVTGFDDIDLSHCSFPALTTVGVPHHDLGRAAWAEMAALLREPGVDRRTVRSFRPQLVLRESTEQVPA
ncbi:LacI family DNA-binding transcriptional regulator [Nesterenkonia rhizosphaerae]